MSRAISHRGPDAAGIWADPDHGIGVAHRRLAILDLSDAGAQPMLSDTGQSVIVFNGEIYNHEEMRGALAQAGRASSWRGRSDTETLLAALETWGVENSLRRCRGMFAFALWNRRSRQLTLARDRIGEKPLYYGLQNGELVFGSELKALRAHPSFNATVDRVALTQMLRYSYVPGPMSIYAGIKKLPPGTYISIDEAAIRSCTLPEPVAYWSLATTIQRGIEDPFIGGEQEAVDALESTLTKAIRLQRIADVPLGAFLSGGVDSSAVVALLQAESVSPVKTFTIGFKEEAYDEAANARAVARHLGTEHYELYITALQARDVIPKLPSLYDEPFADPSQIPTYLVSDLARQHVKVSLSGDAGDELFGGYNRHTLARTIWEKLSYLPLGFRRMLANWISVPSPAKWDALYRQVGQLLPVNARVSQVGDKVQKLADVFRATGPDDIHRSLVSRWKNPSDLVVDGTEWTSNLEMSKVWPLLVDIEHQMMAQDVRGYLPDDILAKLDRAAMGVSLETRIPLLDVEVVELAWRMPLRYKIRNGRGKWLLREVLYRHVPKELVERPKMGFGVPIDAWLRGPLRDWAESLIDPRRLKQEGFFNPAPIRRTWSEHISGERNWQYQLWAILMFQAWLAEQRP